jgi:transcriptional regulator with XRE-family HTH domain
MTGKELKEIREKAKLSQEKLARELDVSVRTVAMWEASDKDISRVAKFAIKHIIEKQIKDVAISHTLYQMNKQAAKEIHAEASLIWLIDGDELVLYPKSSYSLPGPLVKMKLGDKGITTYMARNPGLYNLNTKQIESHPTKKFPGRNNMYLESGRTESLLCAPLIDGETVIGILKLENKLNNQDIPIKAEVQSDGPVFTSQDEECVQVLAKKFVERISPLIKIMATIEYPNKE